MEIYRKLVIDRHHRGAIVSKNYIRPTCRVGGMAFIAVSESSRDPQYAHTFTFLYRRFPPKYKRFEHLNMLRAKFGCRTHVYMYKIYLVPIGAELPHELLSCVWLAPGQSVMCAARELTNYNYHNYEL